MSDFYSPDNVKQIVPHLPREPKWLLLGGPADAREAQTARELWPGIKVVGVEPNPAAVAWQLANGWPGDCPMVCAALGKRSGYLASVGNTQGSLRNADTSELGTRSCLWVPTVAWDHLDASFGSFHDAVMWLDVERSEWEALLGASDLLDRDCVMLVNVEMQASVSEKNRKIHELLGYHAFKHVHTWNDSYECEDRVYVRR